MQEELDGVGAGAQGDGEILAFGEALLGKEGGCDGRARRGFAKASQAADGGVGGGRGSVLGRGGGG